MYTNNLNIIRFVLAFIVFSSHYLFLNNIDFFGNLFDHLASLSVSAFFIISGMLVTGSYYNSKSIFVYLKKRMLRILPAYYLMLFGILLGTCIKMNSQDFKHEVLNYFLYNSIFLNFLSPSNPYLFQQNFSDITNGSLWTIKIEICLYLFIPFVLKLKNKNQKLLILILIIISSVWFLFFKNWNSEFLNKISYQFPGQLRFFLTGVLIYFYKEKIKTKHLNFLLISALMYLFYCWLNNIYQILIPFYLAYLILHIGYKLKKIPFISSDISYGFYLFHFPIIQTFHSYNNFNLNNEVTFILLFGLIFIISLCSWSFVEKKFLSR